MSKNFITHYHRSKNNKNCIKSLFKRTQLNVISFITFPFSLRFISQNFDTGQAAKCANII